MTNTNTVSREELELLLEMLLKRADSADQLIRVSSPRTHQFHRFAGQSRAYQEAADLLQMTLRGASWKAINEQRELNRKASERWSNRYRGEQEQSAKDRRLERDTNEWLERQKRD